jgi:hypothetical protein
MKNQPNQVAQSQLCEILVLEEEIKIIRERIRTKKAAVAAALAAGATTQSGPHKVTLGPKGTARVYPFRGAILRHDDEDVSNMECELPKPAPHVGPLLVPFRTAPPVA